MGLSNLVNAILRFKYLILAVLIIPLIAHAILIPSGSSVDGDLTIDNINIDTNTITTTSGNLIFDSASSISFGTNLVPDVTRSLAIGSIGAYPQLVYSQFFRSYDNTGAFVGDYSSSFTSPSGQTTMWGLFGSNNLRDLGVVTQNSAHGSISTGDLVFETGNQTQATGVDSGLIRILSGSSTAANSGAISITTGTASAGTRGIVSISGSDVEFTSDASEIDFNSAKLTEVVDPTSAQDAATKAYVDNVAAPDHTYEISGVGLALSVGSNALTIALKQVDGSTDCSAAVPCTVSFRDATNASGAVNIRTVTGALSLVIPSGAEMGHEDGVDGFLYVYLVDNSGTISLAASSQYHNELRIKSIVAIATSSDDQNIYGTVLTAKPIRLIARLLVNKADAELWDAVPTEASLASLNLATHTAWAHDDTVPQEMFSARVGCDGTPTVDSEKGGNWIASIANSATGICTLTLNAVGASAADVHCICNAYTTSSGNRLCQIDAGGAGVSAVKVRIQGDDGTDVDAIVSVICLMTKSES
jgi:hypothetical protein